MSPFIRPPIPKPLAITCRCHLGSDAPCPLHPVRDVPTRRQLFTLAAFCFAVAGLGALLLARAWGWP